MLFQCGGVVFRATDILGCLERQLAVTVGGNPPNGLDAVLDGFDVGLHGIHAVFECRDFAVHGGKGRVVDRVDQCLQSLVGSLIIRFELCDGVIHSSLGYLVGYCIGDRLRQFGLHRLHVGLDRVDFDFQRFDFRLIGRDTVLIGVDQHFQGSLFGGKIYGELVYACG